jgi:hypothetical protein
MCKAGLLEKVEVGYRARREVILGFQPPRIVAEKNAARRADESEGGLR